MASSKFTTPEYNFDAAKSSDSGTKTCLLVFGIIAAVCLLLCVGSGIFGYYYVKSRFSMDPVRVQAKTDEMLTIEINKKLEPKLYFDIFVLVCVYTSSDAKDSLLFVSMDSEHFEEEDEIRATIENQLQKSNSDEMPIIETIEAGERTFTVRGEPIKFKFSKAQDVKSKEPYHTVSGIVESNDESKKIMVLLQVRQSEFSEVEIQEMIESIK